ncbi:amino acid adenylation domain-containing protein [Streptomyces sp. NPDC002928]|uniref:amino acid adenylation domain-containing protein n=1 Tax=Streptomyces sp. NPDC002928 TaxID=3154440 RepID=UPI0033AC4F06
MPDRDLPTIHDAVARQALIRPDVTALVSKGTRTTYAELDAAADSAAAGLRALGVGPGTLVPVLLPRSPELVVALLAILKCGAAYSALDHRWPAARIAAVVRALEAPFVITDTGTGLPDLDVPTRPLPYGDPTDAADTAHVDSAAPAAVFFTSGTTGTPKGVLSPHRATTRLFDGRTFADFGRGRVMVQAAPVPWDAFSLELWGMLTTGGTAVIADGDYLFPGDLRDLVKSAGVDSLWLTASLFNLFVDEDVDSFAGLRQVMTGGERLSAPHVRAFLARHPHIALLNGYGPVESCVFATTRAIRPADCELPDGIPVGRPVPGTAVHLLDGDAVVDDGVPGEICVAGDGLALGYLGRPTETAEKFVVVDVDGTPTRLYRTGDLGRRGPDGVLHFLGRADRQVKISGYRVEPAETERAALGVPGIRECVVVPVPSGADTWEGLALFYRGGDGDPGPQALQRALGELLPHYLTPASVHRRGEAFPRTANGKLDRAALLDSLPGGTR